MRAAGRTNRCGGTYLRLSAATGMQRAIRAMDLLGNDGSATTEEQTGAVPPYAVTCESLMPSTRARPANP